jgi:uncharacterized metal-binding protein YceD (DUF177 family)
MQLTLDEELKYLLASGDEAASAQGAAGVHDVWEIDDTTIRPLDILEEVLIMAMPLSALHEAGQGCDALDDATSAESDEAIRPFASLRSTMFDSETGNGNET